MCEGGVMSASDDQIKFAKDIIKKLEERGIPFKPIEPEKRGNQYLGAWIRRHLKLLGVNVKPVSKKDSIDGTRYRYTRNLDGEIELITDKQKKYIRYLKTQLSIRDISYDSLNEKTASKWLASKWIDKHKEKLGETKPKPKKPEK